MLNPQSRLRVGSRRAGPARRAAAACTALAFALQSLAPAWAAPPVADPGAASGKRPIIDSASTSAGAVPVVHIAPPSAQGVSHNLYTQFGVDPQGLVLNNSTTATQTQLAGAISGNPQLGPRPARLIVNEATSSSARLAGQMEVAGQRADVVVAAPGGILCAGCGFINIGRLTLTTGRTEWDASGGGLTGFRVSDGSAGLITVGGWDAAYKVVGMNATGLAQLDLLARYVSLGMILTGNGGDLLDANQAVQLNIVTGTNQIAYDSLVATPVATDEPPVLNLNWAVNVDLASTVRAGRISIVSTQKGVGVNHHGRMHSGSGGIQMDVNGMVTVGGPVPNFSGYGTRPTSAEVVTNGGPVLISAGNIRMDDSRIDAGTGLVVAQADQNITLNRSSAKGGDVMLAAGGNLALSEIATTATGDAVLRAGGSLSMQAGSVKAGGQAVLASRGDLVISPVERGSTTRVENNVPIYNGPLVRIGSVTTVRKEYTPTTIEAGGGISIQSSQGVVNLDAASVRSNGGDIFVQGESVGLFGPKDVLDITKVAGSTTTRTWDETLVAGGVSAEGDITIVATGATRAGDPLAADKGHIFMSGARIESNQGHAALLATGDIDVAHDVTQDKRWYDYYEKKRKLLSTKVTRVHQESVMETVVPSEISAKSISVGAGRDLNIVASTLTADGDIGLAAGRDLSLLSTGEQSYAYESRSVTKRGVFGGGGLSIVVGSRVTNEVTQSRGTQQIGAAVASLGGDIFATAGNQYLQLSSELLSPVGDVHVAAKEVAIQTNNNTLSVLNSMRQTQTGLTLSASHPLVQAGQTVVDMQDARERTSNPRMRALALLTSGLTTFSAYDALAGTKGSVLDYASNGWSIQASLGYSATSFESIYNTSLPQESMVVAGRDLSISATGAAAAGQGDISVVGSALAAGRDLTLRAGNDIHLLAATGRTTEETRTRASAGAIGLKAGAGGSGGGLSVTLAASRTRGFTNGWGTTYFPVELTAGHTLTLDSGRHLELVGATAGGQRVDATVGSKGSGNLLVASPQDASHYIAKEQTLGTSVTIPIAGNNASLGLTYADLKLMADYQSAREQTAIRAGTGGYHIQVNGNTHLKGGVITASSAPAGTVLCGSAPCAAAPSELATQTLTHERLVNRDNASGQSTGLTLNYSSTAGTGALAGSSFGYAQINRAGLGHTDGALGPGTLTITRPDLQVANMLTTLSRSPNSSHQPLAPTFDPARAVQELRAGVAITAGFGKAAYKAAGDYAERQLREAAALRLRAGDTSSTLTAAERSALTEQANELERNWKEGGSARTLVHAVIGGLSYGAGGVVGAVANQRFQQALESALTGSSLSAGAKDAIRSLGSAMFAAGLGGAEAAGAAFNADANNRQLHPREIDWIKANARTVAQRLTDTLGRPVNEQEALFWLTVAGEANVDNDMQRWAGNHVRGLSTSEEALAYDTAKSFIAENSRGLTFVDERGVTQRMLVAAPQDFRDPTVYGEFRNDAAYRDYMWTTLGRNLAPDHMTAAEQAVYEERQAIVRDMTVKELALMAVTGGAARLAQARASGQVTRPLPQNPKAAISEGDFQALLHEHGMQHNGSLTMGLTEDAAREIIRQTQPAGTRPTAAGASAPGPDIIFHSTVDDGIVETVQVKTAASARAVDGQVKGELSLEVDQRSRVIAIQVPEGSSAEQIMGRLRNNFDGYDTSGRQVLIVDPFGKVLVPLQPWPKKGT